LLQKTGKMKNLVVPIDFSAESLNGLKMAILFSQKTKTNISLVNVLQSASDTDKATIDRQQQEAESNFEKIIREFKEQLGNGSQMNYQIKKGRIYNEIVHAAELEPDTIIATSTHGASGFQELFIGSNTFRIISATNKPVIALRKNYCPSSISKIVLPIDLSVDTRQKVPITTELAKIFGAEIHVLAIHTSRSQKDIKKLRSYTSQVAGYIEGTIHCLSNEVHGSHLDDLVLNYAHAVKADLVSITTEQSSGISLILGNTAHQILNKAEIPVLCLTPRNIRRSGTFVTTGG
jgi:nucleotide-binding universal stress UspA family protein